MDDKRNGKPIQKKVSLSPSLLKRTVDSTKFEFETTEQVPELTNIVGQERGRAVMEFGLHVDKSGYNLYVSGIAGTGKTTFTKSLVHEIAKKDAKLFDWCYVNNFEDGYKPKILKLPVGIGKVLQNDMKNLIENLKTDIPLAFNEENYQKERSSILRDLQEKRGEIYQEVNKIAAEYGFIIRQSGASIITLPVMEGKPMNEETYRTMTSEQLKEIDRKSALLQEKILDSTNALRVMEKETKMALEKLDKKIALTATEYHMEEVKKKFKDCSDVIAYFVAVEGDIVNHIEDFLQDEQAKETNAFGELTQRKSRDRTYTKYAINLLVDNSETKGSPVIVADNPTYYNLIGKVEFENRMGIMSTDFTKIKPGFLHYANGGYIIVQAKDLFSKSYAWEGLKRALLNHKLQIENLGEHSGLITVTSLNPDPIPLHVKVIIIGNMETYQLLYQHEEDFSKLFKIRADFDVVMDYSTENMARFASFIHTHCKEHDLRHFDRTAVAKMMEYSLRLAGDQNKLSTRFNQQVETIYEADTWANMMGDELVSAKHVIKAIEEKEYRSSLYEEKLQESIQEGSILIDIDGAEIGQVNGLAIYNLGQYSFGKPSRITATTFVGKNGIINIERESKLGGNIHNKGIYILGGYLGQKFAQQHPLTLTAHIAFEQSYGGVDGDSASSTELYALLSSLAELPIEQGLAVTGSVNQKGEIQPIGGVNEKIEGFFKVCQNKGLTGKQGVLIPHQNVKNLMLKEEVIEAVKEGNFHIYEVKTVEEGIELLTGIPAGRMNVEGEYEENTVFGRVTAKLRDYMKLSEQHEKENNRE
ncbi:Lon protease family protein [Sporosarcina soli]|uniref:endopeptidase La n=1 Tax=Sporosarcina soli TaxID=334736 RepID=A0ABW0TSE0_9BACL